MSFVLKSYNKSKKLVLQFGNRGCVLKYNRSFCDDKSGNYPEISTSTMIVENGLNVHELPIIIRKLRDITEIDRNNATPRKSKQDNNYNIIQDEFNECIDLKAVFTLLSKCPKITPNIALVAIERIYDLENQNSAINTNVKTIHVNLAKGAILDKLIKVVGKTEDTQTILNVLNTSSAFTDSLKYKFCDELLLRTVDNKMSIGELCQFGSFLLNNKSDPKYSDILDKLWVGLMEKEEEIDETNLPQICTILSGLKASKKTMLTLLEQKLSELWYKIKPIDMQRFLDSCIHERYLSMQTLSVLGRWLYTNIHALDDDSLLDIISKFAKFDYTDDQVDKAIEKYITLKVSRIRSQILVVGILNYYYMFKIRNVNVLTACCEYFVKHSDEIPHNFLKSYIYPFGYLYFDPDKSSKFWNQVEEVTYSKFNRITPDDLCSIVLSSIYVNNYPLKLVNRIFNTESFIKLNNTDVTKKLKLIDTALSLECKEYCGPLLPKDQWSNTIKQDNRIKNIINKTRSCFEIAAGGAGKLSIAVLIPHICADETYLIDVMVHPVGLGTSSFNWKSKSTKNENVAILIHLPDHYCSDDQLTGPQVMKKKHLKLLGLKVVSIKYSHLSEAYIMQNKSNLIKYLQESIEKAECCT